MTRLTLLSTVAATLTAVTATIGVALACMPQPDRDVARVPAPTVKPQPPLPDEPAPAPLDPDRHLVEDRKEPLPYQPPPPPARPWTGQDAALASALLDHFAALVETGLAFGDDAAGAEAAIERYLVKAKTSAAALRAQGMALNEAMQADQQGFSTWLMQRAERLQQLGTDAGKLSPAVQGVLMKLFAEDA